MIYKKFRIKKTLTLDSEVCKILEAVAKKRRTKVSRIIDKLVMDNSANKITLLKRERQDCINRIAQINAELDLLEEKE